MANYALQKLRNKINLRPLISLNTKAHDEACDDAIIETIRGKEMLKLVLALYPAYRLIFNLYHFEGYKHREIAQLLGVEEGTSKSNLAQAKRILRNADENNLTIERKILNR